MKVSRTVRSGGKGGKWSQSSTQTLPIAIDTGAGKLWTGAGADAGNGKRDQSDRSGTGGSAFGFRVLL